MRWTPHATASTVVEKDGRFLLVEEYAGGSTLVLNQPAGHVEEGERIIDAARRETLEETGWHVEPEQLLGLYVYRSASGTTYHRTCYIARALNEVPNATLDEGIERAVWLTRNEVAARRDQLRSELVLRCIDDYLSGIRYPLSYIHEAEF